MLLANVQFTISADASRLYGVSDIDIEPSAYASPLPRFLFSLI